MFLDNADTVYAWLKSGVNEGTSSFDLSDVTNAWMYVNWVVDSTYSLSVGDRAFAVRIKERTDAANEACVRLLEELITVLGDINALNGPGTVDNSHMTTKL